MATLYTKGKFCKLHLGGAVQPAVNWSLNHDPKAEDTSNFKAGRAREATLDDATVTFTLLQEDASPYGTATVFAGAYGTVNCYRTNSQAKYAIVPGMLTSVAWDNQGVETTLKANITLSLHGTVDWSNW
jgi:hypothetical protein